MIMENGGETMRDGQEEDAVLRELRGLPRPRLDPARRAATLRAAEKALGSRRRPAMRWPEVLMAGVLALAAVAYAGESAGKLGRIYGHGALAAR
jgi:hypothetical protein